MMETDPSKAEGRRAGNLRVKWIGCVVLMMGILRTTFPPAARGDIYWFQDEYGVVHISNVPVDERFRFKEREAKREASTTLPERDGRGYDALIKKVARAEGLDADLLRAVVETESNYDPEAVSAKGAQGLMQLMPDTARGMGVTDPFHPVENLEAGARHLRRLIEKYGGQLGLALSAYNAGETTVDSYKGIPPFAETRDYVEKVLKAYGRAVEERRGTGGKGRPEGS
jgi:Transglycosylase SLT domain